MDKKYRIEVYGADDRSKTSGPWWSEEKKYSLRGARIAARRIVNERNGMVIVDIVTIADGALIERIVA